MSSSNGHVSRRTFLGRTTMALGALAYEVMRGPTALGRSDAESPLPHFAPKAKRVIFLTQSGGPSQLELFDPKPRLDDLAGTPLPESVRGGQRVTGMTAGKPQLVMPARSTFRPRGRSGMEISDWLPHLASIADDLCLIRSMTTDEINHAPAMTKFLTGHQIPGRPSLGSWVSHGLGSENRDLPDYVALLSKLKRGSDQPLYDHYWGSGFLPSIHQGVKLRAAAEPVLYLQDPEGMTRELRRHQLDALAELNRHHQARTNDPETLTRIEQYEMAYRMQASVPELTDVSDEPDSTFELYGPDARRPGSYAANCILARRMVERGVRFVQLFHPD